MRRFQIESVDPMVLPLLPLAIALVGLAAAGFSIGYMVVKDIMTK